MATTQTSQTFCGVFDLRHLARYHSHTHAKSMSEQASVPVALFKFDISLSTRSSFPSLLWNFFPVLCRMQTPATSFSPPISVQMRILSETPDGWSFLFNPTTTSMSHCLIEHWQNLFHTNTDLNVNIENLVLWYCDLVAGLYDGLWIINKENIKEKTEIKKHNKVKKQPKLKTGHCEMEQYNTAMSTSRSWRLT